MRLFESTFSCSLWSLDAFKLSFTFFARLARSTDSVCVNFFGFTRPAGRPDGKVLPGAIDIVSITVPKLLKNVPKNVLIT